MIFIRLKLSFVLYLCFFNEEVTKSAQKGIYVVLLVAADMRSFVLSLNQGYTYYKNKFGTKAGKDKLKIVTRNLREEIEDKRNFSIDEIKLNAPSKNSLASGYEAGHILGKKYDINNYSVEEVIGDLKELLRT